MAPRLKNYERAVEMYRNGDSVGSIAQEHGLTRQAMWDILKRRGVVFRTHLRFGKENHFYRGGSLANDHAQNLLEEALERGMVKKRECCEICGAMPTFKDGRSGIQAHHCDYNKPLEVMWLCQRCHHAWHKTHVPIPLKVS